MTIQTDLPDPARSDLAAFLRNSTRAAHQAAEKNPLNRALARGTIPRAAWIANLEQLLLIHRALEARIERSNPADPVWSTIADPARRRTPDLEADLGFYQGSLTPLPGPATLLAARAIANTSDDEVVGMVYVTEGSTNGGRFLVRSLAKALDLDPGAGGTRALDPYGDQQPQRWAEFKTALQAVPHDGERFARIRDGAEQMFAIVAAVADQAWAAREEVAA